MTSPNPIAFSIGNFEIRWYGVIIAFAMLLAGAIAYRRAGGYNIDKNLIIDLIIVLLPTGVIGARLYYVLFNMEYYWQRPGEILNIREGGLAIHGGILLAMAAAFIYARVKKVEFFNLFDLLAPSIVLAQSIGRWGNYFNSEAYGGPTNLPWAMTIMGEKVHPTFLYESIWCFGLFWVLLFMSKRKKFVGQITFLYGILYSLERFFVEGLRTDSLMIGSLRQAQVFSIVVIVVCSLLYIYFARKKKVEIEKI